jgi:hypothetical protein
MSTHLQLQTTPNTNKPITPSQAAMSTIGTFPIAYPRKDMNSRERISFRYEWVTFETIWMYNYTVSTFNGITVPKPYSPYQFQSKNEQIAYSNGQLSHIQYYSTAGAAGQFNNISY